jgi:NAD(P)-dependent dehydrogenase (short-subunit alcohol dehydrogenase family)
MSQLRVVVTGGGRGIGRAIALRFAREGAKVCVLARSADELDSVVAEINAAGGEGAPAQMNIEDEGDVGAALWRASEFTGGTFDVLVQCAGSFDVKSLAETDLRTWNRMLSVNLTGPFLVMKEGVEYLEDGERPIVINICSIAAKQGFAGNTAYCASKYGLRGFGDALREELSDKGIRVSNVYPGPTDTSIWDRVEGDWDRASMGKPEDVAEVVYQAYASEGDVSQLDVS